MRKQVLSLGFIAMLVAGCGKQVHIASPADGQRFNLSQPQNPFFYVTTDTNDYSDTTIEFKASSVQGVVTCTNASGTMGSCGMATTTGFGGSTGSANCTTQNPCQVFIILSKGGQIQDYRTVLFSR